MKTGWLPHCSAMNTSFVGINTTNIDSGKVGGIVMSMLTVGQTSLFANECLVLMHSKANVFAGIRPIVAANLKSRAMLWLPPERSERK